MLHCRVDIISAFTDIAGTLGNLQNEDGHIWDGIDETNDP